MARRDDLRDCGCRALSLVWWLARRYATIPHRIPYGSFGKTYFWYGSRAVVWLAPTSFLIGPATIGLIIARWPAPWEAQLVTAIGLIMMAAATPLVALSIKEKIDAARRREP